jgi:calcineurin-like phosphoesterase family protein
VINTLQIKKRAYNKNMGKIFFTSDNHFGHEATWKRFKKHGTDEPLRPFSSTTEMDETMINNWNSVVGPEDTVYVLGDFAMGKTSAPNILNRLSGKSKILVHGNHDSRQVRELPQWAESSPLIEVVVEGQLIILCHYSMRVWNKSHYGSIMLHGHSHGSLPGTNQSLDVGVDCWDYTPVTLEQIKRRLKSLPPFSPVDHHGRK